MEGDLDFGRNLGNWGEIRVGFHRTNGQTYDRFGDPDLVEPQYNNGEYFFKFSYDQLDNVHFPREGTAFDVQWDANRTNLGADTAFDKVSVDWLMAGSRGRNTLLLWTSAGSTLDGDLKPADVQDFYSLGGFFNLIGSRALSLLGPNYAIARAIYFARSGVAARDFSMSPFIWRVVRDRQRHGMRRRSASVPRNRIVVFVAFSCSSGPCTWDPVTTSRATRGTISSWAVRSFLESAARSRGSQRDFRPSRTRVPADRRCGNIRACGTCPPSRDHVRPR